MGISVKHILLAIGLFGIGIGVYGYYAKKPVAKLSVDEILKEHLETRFEEVPRSPSFLLVRDRIITYDPVQRGADPKNIGLAYVNFCLLKDDEVCGNSAVSDKIVYTDFHVKKATKDIAAHKIGWLIESPKGHSKGFKFLRRKGNKEQFDMILTCYRPFLEQGAPFVFAPVGDTSANPNVDIEDLIKDKSKLLSIIASNKNWSVGHKLRHKAVKRFGDKIDSIVGRGYQPIEKTSDGLLNFKYSIVIENRKQDFYFSEKIIDCILCGTVPIYWGCPSIGKFFNDEGIIQFETLDELETILKNLSDSDYNKRLSALRENFRIAHCYLNQDKPLRRELEKAYKSKEVAIEN